MKHTHRCTKCAHHEILYLPRLTDTSHDLLAVAVVERRASGEMTDCGQLEAFICRRCGFTELYTRHAAAIPVDEIPGAKVLVGDPGPGGPYR